MEKFDVINRIPKAYTIGEEIEKILSSKKIPMDNFLKKMDLTRWTLKTLNKISRSDALKIEMYTKVKDISSHILDFQANRKLSKIDALAAYRENTKIFNKIKHLLPLLKNDFKDGVDKLKDITNFLGFEDESEIFERIDENITQYQITNFEPNNLNLYAWLKRGEIDFYKKRVKAYDKNGFLSWLDKKEWENNFYNIEFIFKLPNILKEFGIVLVYTPYLTRTVVGAVRWFDGKPLIQISDKDKCLATFWYILFHEFGHIVKHENHVFFDPTGITKSYPHEEEEANSFANEYLFSGDKLQQHVFKDHHQCVNDSYIDNVSAQFKVNKLFTAFMMKKANIKSKTLEENILQFQFEK